MYIYFWILFAKLELYCVYYPVACFLFNLSHHKFLQVYD